MKKILIVEDHPEIRDLLRTHLEWLGFAVIVAKNGKEGVDIAIAEKPDLVMMNSMMPLMDGSQATRTLRNNPETKDIPILSVTGMSRPGDLQSSLEAGSNDYIVKPFSLEDLEKKVSLLVR
jgi:CheY-like chemotaxis protein